MCYVEGRIKTWQKQQSYGLFDNNDQTIKQEIIELKMCVSFYRNKQTFEIKMLNISNKKQKISKTHQKLIQQNYQHLFDIIQKQQDRFVIKNNYKQQQPMCILIENQQYNSLQKGQIKQQIKIKQGMQLKANQHFKIGKVYIEIIQIRLNAIKQANHYQYNHKIHKIHMLQQGTQMFNKSEFGQQCYDQAERYLMSSIQTNPVCRYCAAKTVSNQDPFVSLCKCQGSSKYVHLNCLVQWIKKRTKIIVMQAVKGIYCAQMKGFCCEICHSNYTLQKLIDKVFNWPINKQYQYLAMCIKSTQNKLLYIIRINANEQKQIIIGRNLNCDICLDELSISRQHCFIRLNNSGNQQSFRIVDNNSKFGTTEIINRIDLGSLENIKVTKEIVIFFKGRTKFIMKYCKKKPSFFKKLFCNAV